MIKEFTCSNFRNVEVDHLKFSRINLLIGPNNAGKSNFIRALSFSANMIKYLVRTITADFRKKARCVCTDAINHICRKG